MLSRQMLYVWYAQACAEHRPHDGSDACQILLTVHCNTDKTTKLAAHTRRNLLRLSSSGTTTHLHAAPSQAAPSSLQVPLSWLLLQAAVQGLQAPWQLLAFCQLLHLLTVLCQASQPGAGSTPNLQQSIAIV